MVLISRRNDFLSLSVTQITIDSNLSLPHVCNLNTRLSSRRDHGLHMPSHVSDVTLISSEPGIFPGIIAIGTFKGTGAVTCRLHQLDQKVDGIRMRVNHRTCISMELTSQKEPDLLTGTGMQE